MPVNVHVGNIEMTQFCAHNTYSLFRLVNSPQVRVGMHRKDQIDYVSHCNWVNKNLLQKGHTHLFLATDPRAGDGVALLKDIDANSAEIGLFGGDIMTARKTQFTSKLLTGILFYGFHHLDLKVLTMKIFRDNKNSLNLAERACSKFVKEDQSFKHFKLLKGDYSSAKLHRALRRRYIPFTQII